MQQPRLNITICPNCGSKRIKRVCRDVTRTIRGRTYRVPSLEFFECPDCGERAYDRLAMRKIEAHSPVFARRRKPAHT